MIGALASCKSFGPSAEDASGPRLGVSEVVGIAEDYALSHGLETDQMKRTICFVPAFSKWEITFSADEDDVDHFFFVIVDDPSGDAHISGGR